MPQLKLIMRNGTKLLIGATSLAAIGFIIYLVKRTRKEKMLEQLEMIADEGYEFAQDILFPLKPSRFKNTYPNELMG